MMLICDAGVVAGYDRRRPRLCKAALNKKYDNYSCHRDIVIALNIKHTPPSQNTHIHIRGRLSFFRPLTIIACEIPPIAYTLITSILSRPLLLERVIFL